MKKNTLLSIIVCFFAANIAAQNTSKVKINLMPCEFKVMEIEYSKSGLFQTPTIFEKVINREVIIPSNSYVHFRFKYPASQINPLSGISVLDLTMIQKHVLGIKMLDNEIQRIAADVNNNGKVTTADIVELRKLIIGTSTENKIWMLMPPNLDLVHTIDDTFTFWVENDIVLNFMPLKRGDVNQSFGCD